MTSVKIACFICPSDGGAQVSFNENEACWSRPKVFGRISYGGNFGQGQQEAAGRVEGVFGKFRGARIADIRDGTSQTLLLSELMTDLFMQDLHAAAGTPARYVKLWENLSIETIGLQQYRRRLVPLYRKIFDIFEPSGKRLLVHYDGRLRLIAGEIAELDIDGIDSFTPAPEGDMTPADGRARWPDKFLWMHPPLGWYEGHREELIRRIERMVDEAGPRRFCLMISEDVPPDWRRTVPIVLEALAQRRSG